MYVSSWPNIYESRHGVKHTSTIKSWSELRNDKHSIIQIQDDMAPHISVSETDHN